MKNKNFSRVKEKVLRINIQGIISEMKKNSKAAEEAKETNEANELLNKSDNKLLGKKRTTDPLPENDEMNEFLYKPCINLSDLGGFEDIVEEIKETIGNPLNYYKLYRHLNVEPVKGILLCGPPGSGKTTIAYAIGGEYNIPFFRITAPQIVSSLSGESENKIRKLFAKVVESAPSILFIDEIESILGRRENASKDMERRIVAQIMSCIDEIDYKDMKLEAPVFIIGATSKPEFIDSSVRRSGRFDKEIHIGFPNQESREKMLLSMAKDKRISENVDFSHLSKITPGYLAADLQSLIREAGKIAIRRIVKNIDSQEVYDKLFNSLKSNDQENLNDNTLDNANENSKLEKVENDSNLTHNINECKKEHELNNFYIEINDFIDACNSIQPSSKREGFTTIPNVTWGDIGGLDKLREELYFDIVMPILEPSKLKKVGIDRAVGVLLYGPPGCGKTLLAKAVANEAKSNFISIKGPELLNKYVGESEKAVRQLFIRARNSSPCIIFFDELDALCPKRSNDNNAATERVVNQLLTEMDGLEERKQVFIIAATNRPDIIDPAMLRPGRLDKLLYVPLPDYNDRLSIMSTIARKIPLLPEIDLKVVAKNKRLEGFSGADLASLMREAQLHCVKRLVKENSATEEYFVSSNDMNYAIGHIIPSVSKQDKEKYENVKKLLTFSYKSI
jgi:ribosome biogenesis ATPase